MEINEIVEKLKYYTEDLPKEALTESISPRNSADGIITMNFWMRNSIKL